jgi:outer membrane lipoprotein-sorting protein
MKRTVIAVAAIALASLVASAQTGASAPKPVPTPSAEQVLDRFVEVTGGRDAYAKHKSLTLKGTVDVATAGISGTLESYNVAPDRFASTIVLNGFGKIRQVYDGSHGWEDSVLSGIRELSGAELALLKRQATFNADAKWREIWKAVELVGTKEVEARPAYVVKLTPHDGAGNPMTNYYDVESGLLVRSETVVDTDAATVPVTVLLSDYRSVDGVKMPFVSEQQLPNVTLRVTVTDAQFDAKIDDAVFAKP